MSKFTLGDFVNVITKSGKAKKTQLAKIKGRASYTPVKDYYKKFRDTVTGLHKKGLPKSDLKAVLSKINPKKTPHYSAMIEGYLAWWGGKHMAWQKPPQAIYSQDGFDISIKPELGLMVDGVPHAIKLYLKAKKLPQNQAELAVCLMYDAFAKECAEGLIVSVLDVRSAQQYFLPKRTEFLKRVLKAEVSYLAKLWEKIEAIPEDD